MNGQSDPEHRRDSAEAMAAELTSPTALRQLVLNYLVHHCYIDTAQAFANDGIGTGIATTAGASSSSSAAAATSASGAIAKQSTSSAHRTGTGVANGSSGHTRTSSRLAGPQHTLASAHPLSAPPLSHEDSSMELEVDNLLALAAGAGENDSAAASSGHHDGDAAATARTPRAGRGEPSGKGKASSSATDAVQEHGLSHHASLGEGEEELSVEELQRVRVRKEVRDHIVAGRIRQAVDLCNRHFPSVLNVSDASKNGEEGGAKNGHASVGRSATTGNASSRDHKDAAKDAVVENERILPANPTSLNPAHLSLNLQIQAFIECVRAASSGASASPPTAVSISPLNTFQSASAMPNMHSIVSNTPGIAAAAISRSSSPAPSSTSSTGSVTSANGMSNSAHSGAGGSSTLINPVLHAALRHAQNLYSEVQSLPPYWRSMYLKELESVTTMLAYTDLERSPVRKYLDQSRRVALAEQINSAIMFRTGKPSQPLVESAVRQTTFCWSTLANEKVAIPTDHAIFSSGAIVGLDRFDMAEAGLSSAVTTGTGGGTTSNSAKQKGKILPPWDLHSFLRER